MVPTGSSGAVAGRLLREAAVRRLLELETAGQRTSAHVELAASSIDVDVRTVCRWLQQAEATGRVAPAGRNRFVVDVALRPRLAYWRGNVSAVHRELVAAAAGGPAAPSMATLQRAVARDLSPGDRVGLYKGEHAARAHDVFLQRPGTYRTASWEADHVEAPVEVDIEGRLVKPWITWFVDARATMCAGPRSRPGRRAGNRSWWRCARR